MGTIEKMGIYFELAVLWIAGSVFLVTWFTLGLGLWLVMLMRSIAVVTFVTLGTLLKRGDIKSTVRNLTRIIAVWPEGVKIAIRNFFKGEYKENNKELKSETKTLDVVLKILKEIFYSILFYGTLYIILIYGIGNFIVLIESIINSTPQGLQVQ